MGSGSVDDDDINNPELIYTIYDIFYDPETSPENIVHKIIVTVAEDIHEAILELVNEDPERGLIHKPPFIKALNKLLNERFGSEHDE